MGTLASAYVKLLKQRKVESVLSRSDFKKKTVLAVQRGYAGALSSQVALEYLQKYWDEITIRHL